MRFNIKAKNFLKGVGNNIIDNARTSRENVAGAYSDSSRYSDDELISKMKNTSDIGKQAGYKKALRERGYGQEIKFLAL